MPRPDGEQRKAWEAAGWDGRCTMFGVCGGKRCLDGDPDAQGRPRFRTPVYLPKERGPGIHAEDRRLSACPSTAVDPWMWQAVEDHHGWRQFGALPSPGSLAEQDARLMDALGIIDAESGLIDAYASEQARARAERRRRG